MRNSTAWLALAPLLVGAAVWSGCGSEPALFVPNQEPNTRISAGPPEANDTGYTVNIFWFGWDDDGFVDHYEVAWETPEDWIGPIFTLDSLFSLQAAESCCVEPIDFGLQTALMDSVYEQFHTFYVRSVDDHGVPDPTPAVRSFNSKTIAPFTQIDGGPADGKVWGSSVQFDWTGTDQDGVVVGYRRALVTKEQFLWDVTDPFTTKRFVEWIDTLTFAPTGPNEYDTASVWVFTDVDSVVFPQLPQLDSNGQAKQLYLFAVRAIDDADAEERILQVGPNARRFQVDSKLPGPKIFLRSFGAGSWRTGDPDEIREVFAGQGLRFEWRGSPNAQSGLAVRGFGYAVEDTSEWSPFSLNSTEWPVQVFGDQEVLWFPDQGPHSFFVRGIDIGGFVSVVEANLRIFDGPRECVPSERIILLVLDTSPGTLVQNGIWPAGYEETERDLIDYWFEGYSYQVFETNGLQDLDIAQLNCATSTVWLVSAAVADGDPAILRKLHATPPNPLPSYVSSGGNIFLLGIQPLQCMRFFERAEEASTVPQAIPVIFQRTLTDSTLIPHWGATHFGISSVQASITVPQKDEDRLRIATSAVPAYPDLAFDPLTWPQGPLVRGFGYYDRDIIPIFGAAEVIYKFNDTNMAVGIQRLRDPQSGGSTVYLGLHPYFVERPAFRDLVQAVLTNFGETRSP